MHACMYVSIYVCLFGWMDACMHVSLLVSMNLCLRTYLDMDVSMYVKTRGGEEGCGAYAPVIV